MPQQWRRRQFVQGAGAAGLGLLAGCGRLPIEGPGPSRGPPAPTVARIGWLGEGSRPGAESGSELGDTFRQGLHELGWVEGQNLAVERRMADGQADRMPGLAAELARLPVQVIVTISPRGVRAAMSATSTVPIVMVQSGDDPVAAGFVASLARPGGNVTGLSSLQPELQAKRLEVLKEAVPVISRVAYLSTPNLAASESESERLRGAATALRVTLSFVDVREAGDVESAFEVALREGAEALLVRNTLPVIGPVAARVADLALQHRLPAAGRERAFVVAGGLLTYGVSVAGQFRRAAYYVDRILKGASPADLPVEQPMTFDFVINLKTAQALGLTIPQHVLLQATEVLQ